MTRGLMMLLAVVGVSPATVSRAVAATSTGGLTNKMPGRVGDTPLIGAFPINQIFTLRSPNSAANIAEN